MTIKKKILFCFLVLLIRTTPCIAFDHWEYKLTSETPKLINSPFFLMSAADLDKNGIKELIVTDFGRFGDHIDEWKQWRESPARYYNLLVLEWDKDKLKAKWHKKWDMTKARSDMEKHKYFLAFEARQMIAWEIGGRTMVETIPAYLGLEWIKGKYVLHEQQGPFNSEPLVGSWVFPWLSASCYQGFPNKILWPRECLVAIRDFDGRGNPKIITIAEMTKSAVQVLRVRRFASGFDIEKELVIDIPFSFGWWEPGTQSLIDRLTWNVSNNFLMWGYSRPDKFSWHTFKREENKDYKIKNLHMMESIGIESYDLPDIYLRSTQKKGIEEYWGYRYRDVEDRENISLLRKVVLKSDLSGFIKEDINFDHHKSFLGVGFFDLKDIDEDGLDEVILVEETGKRKIEDEEISYSNVKDYIRILKWNGKGYQTMWASPPYTKRGTKFLIEDIKNTGKKQLIVMTSSGTIQIWEGK